MFDCYVDLHINTCFLRIDGCVFLYFTNLCHLLVGGYHLLFRWHYFLAFSSGYEIFKYGCPDIRLKYGLEQFILSFLLRISHFIILFYSILLLWYFRKLQRINLRLIFVTWLTIWIIKSGNTWISNVLHLDLWFNIMKSKLSLTVKLSTFWFRIKITTTHSLVFIVNLIIKLFRFRCSDWHYYLMFKLYATFQIVIYLNQIISIE